MLALQKMFINSEDYCFATLKELYSAFKERYPDAKVGFSKFCTSDPNGAFLLVPAGLILFVYAQAIKMHNCWCMLQTSTKIITTSWQWLFVI